MWPMLTITGFFLSTATWRAACQITSLASALPGGLAGDHRVIDEPAHRIAGQIAGEADRVDDLLIERIGQPGHLAAELIAGGAAGVLLIRPLVLADLDVVRLDADLIEQPFG